MTFHKPVKQALGYFRYLQKHTVFLRKTSIMSDSHNAISTASPEMEAASPTEKSADRDGLTTTCTNSLILSNDVNEKSNGHRNSSPKTDCMAASNAIASPLSPNLLTQSTPPSTSSPAGNARSPFSPKSFGSPSSPMTPIIQEAWAKKFLERSSTYSHGFIDSHCHIDLTYHRLGLPESTCYADFVEARATTYPANYEGCVAIFCSPQTFDLHDPQTEVLHTVSQEAGVWLALGCHPKNAAHFTPSSLEGLRKMLLSLPKIVALGEIGLDYSGEFHLLADIQKEVLVSQLKLAVELDLPLVIHCRDADDELLDILLEHIPTQHKIHRHCFTQGPETAQKWMDAFPNMFIGFTPVITYKSAHEPAAAASQIPLDRLLLETDAPYFVPGNIKTRKVKITHPGFALFTAERIAELRGISVDEVLEACRKNTQRMYGI